MERPIYADRHDAGLRLADALTATVGSDPVVLGLARGGVPVAAPVAEGLGAPLDVLVVRKLGVPGHEELAMGAIASGGVRVLNPGVLDVVRDPEGALRSAVRREQPELVRRERLYREGRPAQPVRGREVVLVDDGIATGASMRAAVESLRQREAGRITVAVPVAAASVCAELEADADVVVCCATPDHFRAVGVWYRDFSQTTDDEVRALLRAAAGDGPTPVDPDSR